MQHIRRARPRWWAPCVAVGLLLAAIATAAPPEPAVEVGLTSSEEQPPVYATHNPPLLLLPTETAELRYDVVCPRAEDDDPLCEREGEVYVRTLDASSYEQLPLVQGTGYEHTSLVAELPPRYLEAGGFTYYATLRSGEREILLPSGGRSAPHRAWVMDDPHVVHLDHRDLDDVQPPEEVVLERSWGDGPDEVGLGSGAERSTIGPSSFDLAPDGTLLLMDQVNRRVVVRDPDGSTRNLPVDVTSSFPDLAAGPAGTFYVLESSAPDGATPALKHIAGTGETLTGTRIAEPIPSKVRTGIDGPYVYQYPSAMWFPVLDDTGDPLSVTDQLRLVAPTLLLEDHRGAVVKTRPGEMRLALTDGTAILSSWVALAPTTPAGVHLGAVQTAAPFGEGVVVAFSVYTDTDEAFRVLELGPGELGVDFTVEARGYAESASVSRFRLGPDDDLYQLRSTGQGAEVVAFDLGGGAR